MFDVQPPLESTESNEHRQTAACRLAVERLLAYLKDPDSHRAERDAAIGHMSVCPYCESRMERLIRALDVDEEDRLTCQECKDLLPEYIQAEMDRQAHETRWRPVALHLEVCPHCLAEYTALVDLSRLATGEQGTEPPYYPIPEMPFLRPESVTPPPQVRLPWRWDELGRLVIEFSSELVRALQAPVYQPAYAAAGLKSSRSQRVLCRFSLREAIEDLQVTITAEERRDAPAQCTVIVEVNIPGRGGWPNLAGTQVTLRRGEQELETQWTDAFGKAVFEDVRTEDLANLVFEITPGR